MTPGELKLVEKIVRAKVALESARSHPHHIDCPVDMDMDYMGPCKCGASDQNARIEAALHALDLTK